MPHREIDGQVYVGEVKEKEKARKQYEKAVSSGQTAGLVKWVSRDEKYLNPVLQAKKEKKRHLQCSIYIFMYLIFTIRGVSLSVFCHRASGRKMEEFSVSVNIAAKSNVIFTLTYEELLQRKLGHYEIVTRVKPKHPVQEFQVPDTLLFYLSILIM